MVCLHQPGMAVSSSHHLFRLVERRLAGQMGPESGGLSFKGNSGIPDFHRRKDFFTFFLLHLGQFLEAGKCSELLQKVDSQFPKKLLHFCHMDRLLHILQRSIHRYIPFDGGQFVG